MFKILDVVLDLTFAKSKSAAAFDDITARTVKIIEQARKYGMTMKQAAEAAANPNAGKMHTLFSRLGDFAQKAVAQLQQITRIQTPSVLNAAYAAMAVYLFNASRAASELNDRLTSLSNTVASMGGKTEKLRQTFFALTKQMQMMGVDTQEAMEVLETGAAAKGGDPKAMQAFANTAMGLSKGLNVSLNQTTQALYALQTGGIEAFEAFISHSQRFKQVTMFLDTAPYARLAKVMAEAKRGLELQKLEAYTFRGVLASFRGEVYNVTVALGKMFGEHILAAGAALLKVAEKLLQTVRFMIVDANGNVRVWARFVGIVATVTVGIIALTNAYFYLKTSQLAAILVQYAMTTAINSTTIAVNVLTGGMGLLAAAEAIVDALNPFTALLAAAVALTAVVAGVWIAFLPGENLMEKLGFAMKFVGDTWTAVMKEIQLLTEALQPIWSMLYRTVESLVKVFWDMAKGIAQATGMTKVVEALEKGFVNLGFYAKAAWDLILIGLRLTPDAVQIAYQAFLILVENIPAVYHYLKKVVWAFGEWFGSNFPRIIQTSLEIAFTAFQTFSRSLTRLLTGLSIKIATMGQFGDDWIESAEEIFEKGAKKIRRKAQEMFTEFKMPEFKVARSTEAHLDKIRALQKKMGTEADAFMKRMNEVRNAKDPMSLQPGKPSGTAQWEGVEQLWRRVQQGAVAKSIPEQALDVAKQQLQEQQENTAAQERMNEFLKGILGNILGGAKFGEL